jgi:hypothetical protein
MTGTSANDFRMMEFIDIKHKEYTQKMVEAAPDSDFNVLVQFQPVTQSIVNHAAENGGNVLGLESVVADGPVLMWLIATTVDTPENQEKITPLQVQFRDEINAFAKENDLYSSWEFLNYAYADQDPISTYGDENIQLLKQAAQTYDPEGMFQKLRTTGFHLPA